MCTQSGFASRKASRIVAPGTSPALPPSSEGDGCACPPVPWVVAPPHRGGHGSTADRITNTPKLLRRVDGYRRQPQLSPVLARPTPTPGEHANYGNTKSAGAGRVLGVSAAHSSHPIEKCVYVTPCYARGGKTLHKGVMIQVQRIGKTEKDGVTCFGSRAPLTLFPNGQFSST